MRLAERRTRLRCTRTTPSDADSMTSSRTSWRRSTRRRARRAPCSATAEPSCERPTDPTDLLIELGVPVDARPHVVGLVDGTGVRRRRRRRRSSRPVTATLTRTAFSTGQ